MKQDTYILSNWTAEVKKQQRQVKEAKETRYAALKEFKESCADLFDMADFYHYAEQIGCKVDYLLNIAIYSDSERYQKYMKPGRDIDFRYWYWKQNGHSITKPNPIFTS